MILIRLKTLQSASFVLVLEKHSIRIYSILEKHPMGTSYIFVSNTCSIPI